MIKSKSLAFAVLMGSCASAFAGAPHKVAYLTSWGLSDPAALEQSAVNTYMLSFGQWDEQGAITSSDEMVQVPRYDPYWMTPGYIAWTNLKRNDPQRKMLLAFGGQTYENIWSYIQTPEAREILAQNIVKLMNTDFPVYTKNLTAEQIVGDCLDTHWNGACNFGNYQKAGTVQLDGVDFDFEKAARITPEENANLLALVTRIRALAPKKTMSLTTYHVGADPVECANNAVTENCSYIETDRSSHHGEVIDLLVQSKDIFDFFNVMTYDAGRNFKYQVALENYGRIIGDKSKVVLGNTINAQWGPTGPFVESDANNIARTKWQSENGFGGLFVWNFGASTEQLSMATQVAKVNDMIAAMTVGETPVKPDPSQPPVVPGTREELVTIDKTADLKAINVGALWQQYKNISVVTKDHTSWVDRITLPSSGVAEGSVLTFTRLANWATDIVTDEFGADTPLMGETRTYTFTNGKWKANGFTISKQSQLTAIGNKPDGLAKYVSSPVTVLVVLSDNNWINSIYLPTLAAEGAAIRLIRNSAWANNLVVHGTPVQIARGTSMRHQYKTGTWTPETVSMSYTTALNTLVNSPETFQRQVVEAQKINAIIKITP